MNTILTKNKSFKESIMTVLFWNIESVSTYKFFMGIMSILKDNATHFLPLSKFNDRSFHSGKKKFPHWNKRKGNLSTTFVVTLIWAIDQENFLHSNLIALSSLEKTRVDTVVLVPIFRFRDRQGMGYSMANPSQGPVNTFGHPGNLLKWHSPQMTRHFKMLPK